MNDEPQPTPFGCLFVLAVIALIIWAAVSAVHWTWQHPLFQ